MTAERKPRLARFPRAWWAGKFRSPGCLMCNPNAEPETRDIMQALEE
jgi:hypothetical protein